MSNRWKPFTDDEIRELWDGLTMDDGIRYAVEQWDEPTHTLVEELLAEGKRRDLGLREV